MNKTTIQDNLLGLRRYTPGINQTSWWQHGGLLFEVRRQSCRTIFLSLKKGGYIPWST